MDEGTGILLLAALIFAPMVLLYFGNQRAKTHWKCPKCGNRGPHVVKIQTITKTDYYGWDDLKPSGAKATGKTRGGGKTSAAEYEYEHEFEVIKCRSCGASKPGFYSA
jgi:ribosomal protein L37E